MVRVFSSRSDHSIRFAPVASLQYYHAYHRKSMELKPAVIPRTLPDNVTKLEKVKVEIPEAKRCEIQREVTRAWARRCTTTSGASATTRSTSSSETASPFSTACLETRIWQVSIV